jgi:hypothetical protein
VWQKKRNPMHHESAVVHRIAECFAIFALRVQSSQQYNLPVNHLSARGEP